MLKLKIAMLMLLKIRCVKEIVKSSKTFLFKGPISVFLYAERYLGMNLCQNQFVIFLSIYMFSK